MILKKKKILVISGSTRKNSSNKSILKFIVDKFSNLLDFEIFEGVDKLPYFNPDLDNENLPQPVKKFRTQIGSADGIIICTPEYVFSLPGSLKNAIEWNVSSTLFSNKPVAIIVASSSGEKAFESLELIMETLESKIEDKCKLLIKGPKTKMSNGGIITDKQTIEELTVLVKSLLKTVDDTKK